MKQIQTDHISKTFKDNAVLREVSLEVEQGEIFGLLGPSGAGKTTLIKILTGQLESTSGRASILGTDCRKLTRKDFGKMGMLLDNCGVYERLSCLDNLGLFAKIHGTDKSRIPECLALVGLEKSSRTPAGKLSKGMKQRLALARAVMNKPQLLFLDEPTSGLDPSTASGIHKLLLDLQSGGTTIFLTTHNMAEASALCDNLVLLNEGRIVEQGKPADLCRKYNEENQIYLRLQDGRELVLKNACENAGEIKRYFSEGLVQTIHSSEPDLESVFMKLTGRNLETIE